MANSATVTAGNDILATQYNNLRKDAVERQLDYYAGAGSANAFTFTAEAQYTAYVTGSKFRMKANHTIVAGGVTVNVSSIGAKSVKLPDGSDPKAGDIINGQIVDLEYDGTNFQMTSGRANDSGTVAISMVAGENITVSSDPVPVYVSDGSGGRTAGRFYRADANDTTNFSTLGIYFLKATATSGGTSTIYAGLVTGFASLTQGRPYFLQDTIATIGVDPGTLIVCVGRAYSSTALDTRDRYMKCHAGILTDPNTASSANNDEEVNIGFYACLLEIDYWLQGHGSSTGSATRETQVGKAVFQASAGSMTCISNNVYGGGATGGSDGAAVSSLSISDPTSTTTSQAGTASGTSAIKITISIPSVDQNSFTVRKLTQQSAAPVLNARCRASYKVWGY